MGDIPLSQTQGFMEETPYTTPQANVLQSPPPIQRGRNPNPMFPSEALIRLVEDRMKPKFNETILLIKQAMKMAVSEADTRFLTPIIKHIQTNIDAFVVAGGRKKTKKRSKFRSRS